MLSLLLNNFSNKYLLQSEYSCGIGLGGRGLSRNWVYCLLAVDSTNRTLCHQRTIHRGNTVMQRLQCHA
jgi:hypothetical protein